MNFLLIAELYLWFNKHKIFNKIPSPNSIQYFTSSGLGFIKYIRLRPKNEISAQVHGAGG